MKRTSIIAVLSLLAGILGIVGSAAPAYAHNSPSTVVETDSPQPYGHALMLTATVGGDLGLSAAPQGTVDFYEVITEQNQVFLNTATLHDVGGEASVAGPVPYCCLSVGTHTIRGYYTSSNGQNPSSGTTTATITQASTTTTLSEFTGSSNVGDPVTFTATIHRSTGQGDHATGAVDFFEGSPGSATIYKTVPVDSLTETAQADLTLPVGIHAIQATYSGDGNYTGSTSAAQVHTVSKRSVSNTLTASATDITYGTPVTFTSTVASTSPTTLVPAGTVRVWQCPIGPCPTVSVSPTLVGSGALNQQSPDQATFTTNSLPVGTGISFFSDYGGDANFVAKFSNAVTVNVTKANSRTDISTSTPTTLLFGQTSTFDAFVSGPNGAPASGSVQFKDGANDLGAAQPITDNRASFSTSTLPAGTHQISVVYGGDGNLFGSTSNALTVVVNKADTTTAVTTSGSPSTGGQPVTFTATVTSATGAPPTGAVQFMDGSSNIGLPKALGPGGVVSITVAGLAGGDHTISAVYSGDAGHNPSTGTVFQRVTCDTVVTGTQSSLTASPGATCLQSANVGNLTVPAGARLLLVNSTIRGTITSRGGAGPITICGTHIGGNLKISGAGGFLLIGDPIEDGCAANTIDGVVILSHNTGGLELGFNNIGGRTLVSGNVGAGPAPNHLSPEVEANTIGGNLACTGNSPVASDDGRSNGVDGRKIGECSAPGF